jgi:hypothetical protein
MSTKSLFQRRLLFFGLNAVLLLASFFVIVGPLMSHFAERSDDISENAAQLAQFHRLMAEAGRLAQTASRGADPYLAGAEERVASADLQAHLQSLAAGKGATILALRSLRGRPQAQWRSVAVGLEVEGAPSALRELISAIEGQTPFLFITEITLRTLADGDDGQLRANLTVEGALRDGDSGPAGPLMSENQPGPGR